MRLDKYISSKYNITRSRASDLIKLGSVSVNQIFVTKPSYTVKETDLIKVDLSLKYESRAGSKLEEAIRFYNLDFQDKTVLDVGSSTGGFTSCSLSFGAKVVYAYDVGKNQMDQNLRQNPRIRLFEQTNILSVKPALTDICLVDVSFTSVIPIINHLKDQASLFIVLFKPQFEVGKKHLKGGIVKDEQVIKEAINNFLEVLASLEIKVIGYKKVQLKGKKGNQEYIFVGEKDA